MNPGRKVADVRKVATDRDSVVGWITDAKDPDIAACKGEAARSTG